MLTQITKLAPLFIGLIAGLIGHAGTLTVDGQYQGQDLYVQNSYAADGVGFCAFEVLVNDEVTSDEVNSSAFVVDLSLFAFSIGDPVSVIIRTKSDCDVRIINPQALEPQSTCIYSYIGVDLDGKTLNWKTKEESGKLDFVVEQFRWNKWIEVGRVAGKGQAEEQGYAADISTQHGENRFRVKQVDARGDHPSDAVVVMDEQTPEIKLASRKVVDKIEFSENTRYELYSEYGELKASGNGAIIEVAALGKGTYFVNFGNKFGETVEKK